MSGAVFALLLFRPAYMIYLRRQARIADPKAWAALSTNGRFRLPIPELTTQRYNDEAIYAARIHQIQLHGIPRNPYWRDDRLTINWIKDCIPFFLMASVSFLCGGDLTLTWTLSVALLGVLWFIFFRGLFRRWTGRDDVAAPLALFSVLFPDFYLWFFDVNFSPAITLDRWTTVFFQTQSRLLPEAYRLPFNWLSFYLVALIFLWTWRVIRLERRVPWEAGALGLAYGATVFVHPFEFLFSMTTLALLWADAHARKSAPARRINLSVSCAASLLLPAFFTYLFLFTVDDQTRRDSAAMVGSVKTHQFFLTSLIHLLAAGVAARLMKRESNTDRMEIWRILIATQIAAFLLRNLQVVVGFHLSPFHYITLGSVTGATMLFLWLSDVMATRPIWTQRRAVVCCGAIFLLAFAREKIAAERTYSMYGLPADMESALDWTRNTLPTDALILTLSMETTKDVALFTKAKLQVPPADSNVSGLFTTEKYLAAVAQLLKSSHADMEKFLMRRWILPPERGMAFARLSVQQNVEHTVDTNLMEPAQWFHPFLHMSGTTEKVLEGRAMVRSLYAEAEPLAGRYYLWINEKDREFIREDPESFGGREMYRNPTVRIYAFGPP